MPDRFQETHIRHVPLFNQLSDYQFGLVARAFEVRRYNPGDFVVLQGTDVIGMFILAAGQLISLVGLPDGQRRQMGTVVEGQFLYQDALFQQQRADSYLQAVRPTTVLLLTRVAMSNLLAHHPELKSALGLKDDTRHYIHDVHFKTQRENEEVLLKSRRHWFAFMRWMWIPLAIIALGLMFSAAFPTIAVVTVPVAFIIGLVIGGYIFLEWLNDAVIVTDQRVVRIVHTILTFHEMINEVSLESVQEANAEIPTFDIFARIFRYGDVEIKTAGSSGNFTLDFMHNPEKLQDLIMEDARHFHIAHQARERESMLADVERWTGSSYRAGQNPPPQNHIANAASEDQLKNIYTVGEGPMSPFISSFPTKNGGIVYRKHWSVWMRAVALPALVILGSIIGMIALLILPDLQLIGAIGWAIAFVTGLIGIVWFYLSDWDWRHDYYLIADNNITIINQRPLWLQNESDQILLKQVDNVVAETKGFLQQLLRFGDVKVALVGADDFKLFDDISNPRAVQGEITRRQQRLKQRDVEEQERTQREILGEYLSLYHQTQSDTDQGQTYSDARSLPYQPNSPETTPRQPVASPFGNRPRISQARPYQPNAMPPLPQQQRPAQQAPYTPLPQYPQQQAAMPPYPQGQQGQAPTYPQQAPPTPMPPPQQGQQQAVMPPYPQGQQGQAPTYPQGQQGQVPPTSMPPYPQLRQRPSTPQRPSDPYQAPSTPSGSPPKLPQ